jgi:hypothetical protein
LREKGNCQITKSQRTIMQVCLQAFHIGKSGKGHMCITLLVIFSGPVEQHFARAVQRNGNVPCDTVRHSRVSHNKAVVIEIYIRVSQIMHKRGKGKLQVPVALDILGKVNPPPDTVIINNNVCKPGSHCRQGKTGQGWEYINKTSRVCIWLGSKGIRKVLFR